MREVSRSGDAGQPEENTEGATSFTELEGGASAAVSELPTSQCMNSAMTCKGLSTKWPAAEPDRHGPPRCRGCSPGESARFLHLSLLKMCCDAVIRGRPCALSRQFLECPVLRDSKPLQVPKFRHGQSSAHVLDLSNRDIQVQDVLAVRNVREAGNTQLSHWLGIGAGVGVSQH